MHSGFLLGKAVKAAVIQVVEVLDSLLTVLINQ
jgi:hypothetical protein